jgi:predicted transcriptional regulator
MLHPAQAKVEPLNKLIRMFVEPILDEVFPDETGAARLQQVGLFTVILMLQGDEKPITATRLAAMTGQAEAQIGRLLRKLIKLKLVERQKILNKQGRGHALHLVVKYNAKTRRLADAISKSVASKAV